MNNPILLNLPVPIRTARLLLRPPQVGDGQKLNQAIIESFTMLNKWMDWASHIPSIEESEMYIRTAQAQWILRQDLPFLIFDVEENQILGAISLSRMDWKVPRFEIVVLGANLICKSRHYYRSNYNISTICF